MKEEIVQGGGRSGRSAFPRDTARGLPFVLRVLCLVVALILLLEAVAYFYGRDLFLFAAGTKNYLAVTRGQDFENAAAKLSSLFSYDGNYNTYDLTANSSVSDPNLLQGAGAPPLFSQLAENLTAELKLSRDPSGGTLGALLKLSGGGTAVNATASLSSQRLVLSFPEASGVALSLKKGEIPQLDGLFAIPENLTAKKDTEKAFDLAAVGFFSTLQNRNVTVARNRKLRLAKGSLTCDLVTVSLSETEFRQILTRFISEVNSNKNYADARQAVFNDTGYLLGMLAGAEGDTINTGSAAGYEKLKSEIQQLKTGTVSVAMTVSNSLLSSSVLAVSAKTGSGLSFYHEFYSNVGVLTYSSPKTASSPGKSLTVNYSRNSAVYSGTYSLKDSDSPSEAFTGTFRTDTSKKSVLGLCDADLTGYQTVNEVRYFIKASLRGKGAQDTLKLSWQHSGKDSADLTLILSGSTGVYRGPAADSSALDIGKDQEAAQLLFSIIESFKIPSGS